jgi:hypothetical protein
VTVSSILNRIAYTGTGALTPLAVSFPFHAQADLKVIETIITTGVQTVKVLTTDYTITGTVDALGHYSNGGTVTPVLSFPVTVTWTIYRDPSQVQAMDLTENNNLPAETVEAQFDYQTMLIQRVADLIVRSLHQPDGDTASVGELPSAVSRASKYLAFNSSGDPVAADAFSSNPGSTPVSAYMVTVLDDLTASDARVTLGVQVPDIIDAKGDSLWGTANNTLGKLTVSTTTGLVPVVDPSVSTGVSWSHRAQDNPIINGNMEVWQRGTTFAAIAGGSVTYTADRWKLNYNAGAAIVTIGRSTNVPSVGSAGVLFNYSLEIDVTTADAAIAAGDQVSLIQAIEGYNWRHFAQRAFVVSFWVLSSKTGIHCVALTNNSDRSYVAEYTVNVADTWEYKTVTVTASPSAGTWNYTTTTGLSVAFALMGGSTYQTTANAWQNGVFYNTSNQVNVLDNTANFFRLTGVKMELGSVATPIQFRSFQEELALCKRYYQKSFNYATAPAQNAGVNGAFFMVSPFTATSTMGAHVRHSEMRTTFPTIVTYNPSAANVNVRNTSDAADDGSPSIVNQSDSGFTIVFTPNAGNTVGDQHGLQWTSEADL